MSEEDCTEFYQPSRPVSVSPFSSSPSMHDRPRPVQIMRFEPQSQESGANSHPSLKLVLDKEALTEILGWDNVRPIAVISAAGATGGGKSFFLGRLLRHLEELERKNQTSQNDGTQPPVVDLSWPSSIQRSIVEERRNLPRFTFGGSEAERTMGIWAWSHPFKLRAGGKPFDVLVIDTQGVFDEVTSPREWSIIVGLSLLISSTLLFNFTHDLNESHLEVFGSFLAYGRMAKGMQGLNDPSGQNGQNGRDHDDPEIENAQETRKKLFQKLVFLIRDWNKPSQFNYGSTGGQEFIRKKLEVKPTHSATQGEIRRKLVESFDLIQCHLLPHPSQRVLQPDFDGSNLEGLPLEFVQALQEAISSLVSCSSNNEHTQPPLNRIRGLPVTATDFIHLVERYVDQFNGDLLPDPQSLYESTLQVFSSVVVRQAVGVYSEIMEGQIGVGGRKFVFQEELNRIHTEAEEKALEFLRSSSSQGVQSPEAEVDLEWKNLKARLQKKMSKVAVTVKFENNVRKREAFDEARGSAFSSYRDSMKAEIDGVEFFDEEQFLVVSKGHMDGALSKFLEHLNKHGGHQIVERLFGQSQLQETVPEKFPAELRMEWKKVKDTLTDMTKGFAMSNQLKREAAESAMSKKVLLVVAKYKRQMVDKLDNRFFPVEDLPSLHSTTSKTLLSEFHNLNSQQEKILQSRLFAEAPEEIKLRIDAAFETIQKVVAVENETILNRGKIVVAGILEKHRRALDGWTGTDLAELDQLHLASKEIGRQTLLESDDVRRSKSLEKVLLQMMHSEMRLIRLDAVVALNRRLQSETVKTFSVRGAVATGLLASAAFIVEEVVVVGAAAALGPIAAGAAICGGAGLLAGAAVWGAVGFVYSRARGVEK